MSDTQSIPRSGSKAPSVKAFLSTKARRRYKGTGDIFAGITPTRTTPELAAMAEQEVRRILAATERPESQGRFYYWSAASMMAPGSSAGMHVAGTALRDALAAFIALPID